MHFNNLIASIGTANTIAAEEHTLCNVKILNGSTMILKCYNIITIYVYWFCSISTNLSESIITKPDRDEDGNCIKDESKHESNITKSATKRIDYTKA